MRWWTLITLLVVVLLASLAASGRNDMETTREEILESRRRRSKQLEAMLMDAKQRLADHTAGVRFLDDQEKKDLDKKIQIYERKLETMQGELDEREIERIIKREQIRNERIKERRGRRTEL